ncbi:MAG: glutamate-1-semialdehyde 2,1-aminomutase [Hyphomicrobiaceae bacterium]|nr:glutamate-1-semialdehyde 2,1-aminomutase [Hyphomicrobiaceae bacterium]
MDQHISEFARSDALKRRAHELIPGGAHTYAKGDDQFPQLAPGFIARGRGCHVWDPDGNRYIEYGMGLRAVTLGHAYPDVVAAVAAELANGCNFNRPAPIEVECAEALLGMIEGAEMAKFCKDGSGATSAAIKIARAYTGRDYVAICADHPFFSTYDWFMGTTPINAGIPQAVRDLTLKFRYNDIASVEALFAAHRGAIACLILEPARIDDPADGFLAKVQRLCAENGALFVLDEMITGFRWHNGGGQKVYGVVPDLSCFGKALANGFSVSALVGKREYMRLGGLDHTDRPRVFLMSTTHGAETHGLAAAIATMKVYREEPVVETLHARGRQLKAGIEEAATRHGVQRLVQIVGRPCCLFFTSQDGDGKPSQPFRTLLMQEIIRRGVLAPSLVVSYAHTPEDVERTIEAFDGALAVYARALSDGVERFLVGAPTDTVYRAFNKVA